MHGSSVLYIQSAAEQLGLPLLDGVHEDFQRIADAASLLMEFDLDQVTEAAPGFQP